MAQIKTNLQYGVTGSLQTGSIAGDAIDGTKIADDAINSEHLAAGGIDTAHIADDQITLAKMASGTDGNVITYDASGNPAVVATGTSGHFLKSQGAGSVPVFAAAAGFDVTSITGATALGATPADTDEFVLSDAGTLKRVDYSYLRSFGYYDTTAFKAYKSSGNITFSDATWTDVALDGELWDYGSNYNTTNYKYTIPVTGTYFFNYGAAMNAGVDNEGKQCVLGIGVNTLADPSLSIGIDQNNSRFRRIILNGMGTLSLNATDVVKMVIYLDRSDNNSPYWQGGATPLWTFLEGWRIK